MKAIPADIATLPASLLRAALVFLVLVTACVAEERMPGQWTRLEYAMRLTGLGGGELAASLTPEVQFAPVSLEKTGFTVNLSWFPRDGNMEAYERLRLRLHYPDGRVVEPSYSSPPVTVTSGVVISLRSFVFPWGRNALEEAWLELEDGDRTYWLEVPYGFTRSPELPLPPAEITDETTPSLAPAMLQAASKDVEIIRWWKVRYDFGPIADGQQLEVDLTHAACTLRLRRTKDRWSIHDPITTVRLEKTDGETIVGEQIAARINDAKLSPSEREDEFTFTYSPLKGRTWGDLIVTVGETSLRRTIPLGTFLEGMMSVPSDQ